MTKTGQVLFTACAFLILSGFATISVLIYQSNRDTHVQIEKIMNQQKLQEQQIKLNAELIGDTQVSQEHSYDALQKQVTEQSDEISSLKGQK
ncbi:hypothetical protein COC69_05840 [Bacillus cereus]|uniref:Uncharacterized protein n=1 Tax=Bacillus cereus TaxID=1396 RepID=A0A9X7CR63_BACCE|nr:hypothetical protein [Bacillus cereus]PGS81650.1 hypothetical protein COC69_05840 [Bacillus cereus]